MHDDTPALRNTLWRRELAPDRHRYSESALVPAASRHPDRRVADCRTHLENAPGPRNFNQKRQQAADGWSDDLDVLAAGSCFHFGKYRIARRQQLVDVSLDGRI
jgi:hypothetical protein